METRVLVLTDVQGSTRLWQDEPAAMDAAMQRHHEIVHGAVARHNGWRPVDQGEGDAVFAAFSSASKAVEAAVQVQRELAAEPWPTSVPLRVRIGMHVGEVTERAGNLYGDPVNRCARLRSLGAGGQTLLSAAVYELVRDKLPRGASVTSLGEHRMKDLTRPEQVWQLDLDGLPSTFPPLASLDRVRHNLPVQATPFIGRERELTALVAAVREHRLVTLTGFGGMGKTRTALQAAAEVLGDPVAQEVFFVDLAAVTSPGDVPARVAESTGTRYDEDPLASLVASYGESSTLLVLDNLEQVLGCAPFIAELLSRTAGLRVLATSREALRVRAERVVQLRPMAVPSQDSGDLAALDTFEAVRLFLDRARAVKPEFQVTNDNAPAIAAVCDRLDGHPLALELAASRLRMMSVDALRTRLDSALKVLTGGGRDMPERHQTLRATIAWSYEGLEDDERLLLARMSCLPAAADFELLEATCGDDLDVFSSLEVLVDRSLVRTGEGELGETRYGLLVSIRDYAQEQLDAHDRDVVDARHAAHVLLLAETARQHPSEFEDVAFVRRELPHVRVALSHLLGDDDHAAYTRLVAAVAQGLHKNALDAEAVQHLERALTFDNPVTRQADLLGTLAFIRPSHDADEQALAAARRAGDDDLLASALVQALSSQPSVAQVKATLIELEDLLSRSSSVVNPASMRAEAVNVLSGALRYADPSELVGRLRQLLVDPPELGTGPYRVRLARILLDHGRIDDAAEALGPTENLEDFNGIVGWLHFGRAERGRLLCAQGDPEAGAALAWPALEALAAAEVLTHYAAIAAVTCSAALGRHDDVVRGVDLGRAWSWSPGFASALTWRRGRALLAMGQPDRCRAELDGAREILRQSELHGPRELLGCLVAEALLVHDSDPSRAARLLGSVEGHRTTTLGRWTLPHGTDRDADYLNGLLLPQHQAAYDEGLRTRPENVALS